eukprot:scaffold1233_cov395-Prasinococcus_capsulatus_cf.AAC.10
MSLKICIAHMSESFLGDIGREPVLPESPSTSNAYLNWCLECASRPPYNRVRIGQNTNQSLLAGRTGLHSPNLDLEVGLWRGYCGPLQQLLLGRMPLFGRCLLKLAMQGDVVAILMQPYFLEVEQA